MSRRYVDFHINKFLKFNIEMVLLCYRTNFIIDYLRLSNRMKTLIVFFIKEKDTIGFILFIILKFIDNILM
ncbi:hypothetical protein DLM86_23915 [Paenibacillus flagellatus]|uniref:Uncharacterized protein n=1 Tax=Paenibacillus flagellatus TaxID=2211139 RepID=A0A2V5KL63_9BACL|nr:hypothetical protein DLM86_23915 [Paenibacillus flagellatus]